MLAEGEQYFWKDVLIFWLYAIMFSSNELYIIPVWYYYNIKVAYTQVVKDFLMIIYILLNC